MRNLVSVLRLAVELVLFKLLCLNHLNWSGTLKNLNSLIEPNPSLEGDSRRNFLSFTQPENLYRVQRSAPLDPVLS
jgi:hypothetical protein